MKKIYKSLSLAAIFTALFSLAGISQNAWINEIHYDNAGADVGEFIEVVIENAGNYTLSNFSVVLYNGNNGNSYDTKTLDQFTAGAVSGNFSIFYFTFPQDGIQNGAPDGMCLAYQSALISGQWLSYEGTMTANDGPAAGLLSVDIGVSETNTTPVGQSLQLSGTGTAYGAFTWQPPAGSTPGQLNNDQSFGGAPLPEPSNYPTAFASSPDNITIALTWTDATGAQLPSKYLIKVSDQDNITAPTDGTPVADDIVLSDGTGAFNVNYGLETYTFYHLDGETQYFFKIYPYTNAGANINYKTDGTAPSTSATTEPVINQNTFESNSFNDWTAYTVASDKDWGVVNFGGALGTTYFAQMNGYQESEPSNDWLISPSMNLDVYGNEKMIFYSQWRFGDVDTELKLKYSTNYSGGDPMAATWTELTFTKSAVQDIWTNSGNVSLAGITGSNVHVAFQYLSSGNPRRWGVDEIVICGGAVGPNITVTSPVAGDIWEQGTSHDITWSASNTTENVMIELTTNASAGTPAWSTLVASVPAASGSWTWLIPSNQTTSDDCKIRVSDFGGASDMSDVFSIIEPVVIPQLVITEIMYNNPGNDSLEFVEIYNHDDIIVDMEGFYFSEGIDFTFPALSLAQGEYVLVCVNSNKFQQVFGMSAYQFNGNLINGGERITLKNNYGMIVDSVTYDDAEPWPLEADGEGPSLTLCDPGLDNGLGENWLAATEFAALYEGDSVFATPGAGCASWPVAQFTGDPTIVMTGGSVTFTDESTGEPTEWIWTFEGGTPNSFVGQNPPAVVYAVPGIYDVILYVSNQGGSSTEEKTDYIQVGDAPVADFTGSPLELFVGGSVDFTDLSTGSPDTWLWEFQGGNPATSGEQNPQDVLYPLNGLFKVTLTVSNIFGTDIMVRENYIDVLPIGIDENDNTGLGIYPNPNNGSFRLINPYNEEISVSVYSIYGQLVKSAMIGTGESMIDLGEAADGIYMIRYNSRDGKAMQSERIIVF